jgi:uncharacterized membrane protein HdeD (DUF308 family)
MMRNLFASRWLLAAAAALEVLVSLAYLNLAGRSFHIATVVLFIGIPTLFAGVCVIAAAALRLASGRSWLLMLNGLACLALGTVFTFEMGRAVAFRSIALLVVIMAGSSAVYAALAARVARHRALGEWLAAAAAILSVGFTAAFLGFAMRWIPLKPVGPSQTLHWLGSYFGFSALCVLALALRIRSIGETHPRSAAHLH